MVDVSGRVDTFVVPRAANAHQVADLWKRFLEVPDDMGMDVKTGNGVDFYSGLVTAKDLITYTFRATNFRGDVRVFEGSPHFEADQIGRLVDFKTPPFSKCQLRPRPRIGPSVQFDDEVVPLGLKILKAGF
jgi:hypothetical protein